MLAAIRLVISENGKLIETVTKETDTQPLQLLNSLEDFRQSANATITNLIEENGASGQYSDDDGEEDDEEDDDKQVSPKKRKK